MSPSVATRAVGGCHDAASEGLCQARGGPRRRAGHLDPRERRIVRSAGNLQRISKEIQDKLQLGFKLGVRSPVKHPAMCWAHARALRTGGRPCGPLPTTTIGDHHDEDRSGPLPGLCHARNRSGFGGAILSGRPRIRPDQQLRLRRLSCFRGCCPGAPPSCAPARRSRPGITGAHPQDEALGRGVQSLPRAQREHGT